MQDFRFTRAYKNITKDFVWSIVAGGQLHCGDTMSYSTGWHKVTPLLISIFSQTKTESILRVACSLDNFKIKNIDQKLVKLVGNPCYETEKRLYFGDVWP